MFLPFKSGCVDLLLRVHRHGRKQCPGSTITLDNDWETVTKGMKD